MYFLSIFVSLFFFYSILHSYISLSLSLFPMPIFRRVCTWRISRLTLSTSTSTSTRRVVVHLVWMTESVVTPVPHTLLHPAATLAGAAALLALATLEVTSTVENPLLVWIPVGSERDARHDTPRECDKDTCISDTRTTGRTRTTQDRIIYKAVIKPLTNSLQCKQY